MSGVALKLWRSRRLLTLRAFDISTAEGRADERHRRLLLSTGAAATAKVVSVSTALISVPLTLHYLGAERYGMWLSISTLAAFLSFADLGMGNGLLSRVASAHGRDDSTAIRSYVSSAFGMLVGIACLLLTLFGLSYTLVPWASLFNVQDATAAAEAGPAVAVFITCFALSLPAAVVQKVQAGLQQGFTSNLWQCVGSLTALIGVIAATQLKLGTPWLVAAFVGAPLLVATINGLTFFLRRREIAPRLAFFSRTSAATLLGTGILFLVLQIAAAVSYSSDAFIIAHLMGPATVPQYSVPERLFNIVGQVLVMGLAPLWPAYGEALTREDRSWVRQTFSRSLMVATGVAALAAGLLALTAPFLIQLWVGPSIQPSPQLILGLATWKVMEAAGNVMAMLLNAAHLVRIQTVVAVVTALVTVGLKIFLIGRWGVAGAVWGSIIAFMFCAAAPLGWRIAPLLRTRVTA